MLYCGRIDPEKEKLNKTGYSTKARSVCPVP